MGHTATLLANGEVLIAGGSPANAELYDPVTDAFATAGTLTTARRACTAALLTNGKVLIAGGNNGGIPSLFVPFSTAELYDPAGRAFAPTGPMPRAGSGRTATLLPGGKVLVVGGSDGAVVLASADLYDPVSETFAATSPMSGPRIGHTATMLANGEVLVAGGSDGVDYLASAELY